MPWYEALYEALIVLVPASAAWCMAGVLAIVFVDTEHALAGLINDISGCFDSILWEFCVLMTILSIWPIIVDTYGSYQFLKWFINLGFWGSPRDPDSVYPPMHVEYPGIMRHDLHDKITDFYGYLKPIDRSQVPRVRIPNV